MKIKSNGSIVPSTFTVQQYNTNVDIKCFEIPRFYYGNTDGETDISELYDTNPVDLSTCHVRLRVSNPDDLVIQGNELYLSNESGETIEEDDDIVVVNWIMIDSITQYAGKRTYQIEFYNNDDVIVFRTKVMNFTVSSSLDSEKNINEKDPNIVIDFQTELEEIMGSAQDYSEYIDNTIESEMQNKINYYHKYTNEYITQVENENIIPIGITQYNSSTLLFVFVNGILYEDSKYSIDGLNIMLNEPLSVANTKVNIVVLKTMTTDIEDYDLFKGEDGAGVPTGGTTGQVLSKKSNADNDTEWVDQTGGSSSIVIDTEMSDTSENAVQNKVIKEYVDDKVDFSYSTEPVFTGKYWIDGKKIYSVVAVVDTLVVGDSSYSFNTIKNAQTITHFNGVIDHKNTYFNILNRGLSNGNQVFINAIKCNTDNLSITITNSATNTKAIMTLEFTKTTD